MRVVKLDGPKTPGFRVDVTATDDDILCNHWIIERGCTGSFLWDVSLGRWRLFGSLQPIDTGARVRFIPSTLFPPPWLDAYTAALEAAQ